MLFRDATIIKLDTVGSTNNYVANLLNLSHVPEGTVITALEQTHGKGQRGSNWVSAHGDNLLCSMVVYPTVLKVEGQFLLSQVFALAVHELVEQLTNKEAFIKWPNDIIVQNKKVAGILIETSITENKIQSAIVGMGININQREFDLPLATSVGKITNKYVDLDGSLDALIQCIARYYSILMEGHFSVIQKKYHALLYNLNVEREYHYHGKRIIATILNVDPSGLLVLRQSDGQMLKCDVKEIAWVW